MFPGVRVLVEFFPAQSIICSCPVSKNSPDKGTIFLAIPSPASILDLSITLLSLHKIAFVSVVGSLGTHQPEFCNTYASTNQYEEIMHGNV